MEEKFRVYDAENNTYVNQHHNPIFMDCETGEIYLVDYASPDPKNLIQSMEKLPADKFIVEPSTGLKDMNGKEIYEGDIVLDYYDGDDAFIVEWDKDIASFRLTGTDNIVSVSFDNFYSDKDLEVIGNIHENPEWIRD